MNFSVGRSVKITKVRAQRQPQKTLERWSRALAEIIVSLSMRPFATMNNTEIKKGYLIGAGIPNLTSNKIRPGR